MGGEATPHARGSTLGAALIRCSPGGYPACAGIDPESQTAQPSLAGLPRMRGDRPRRSHRLRYSGRATPHARGSTLGIKEKWSRGKGYPACAGIDLTWFFDMVRFYGLPRMRGDRPIVDQKRVHPREATPHARGSTHCH